MITGEEEEDENDSDVQKIKKPATGGGL